MKTKDELIEWLRDAYAMEKTMETALKKQSENQKLPMEARELAAAHLVETQGHAEAVGACLEELDSDPSLLKNTVAQGMEIARGLGTMLARDEHIKDIISAYTSEHFEIACYTSLAAAASQLGLPVVERTCRAILKEEVAMAEKLQASLPSLIEDYLVNQ